MPNKSRVRALQTERRERLQQLVDQELTLAEMGRTLDPKKPISGERVRQLIVQLGIKGSARKRGRRPKPLGQTATDVDLDALKGAYFGDVAKDISPMPLAALAKKYGMSTNRLRRLVTFLKWGKRTALPRPKRKTPRVYDVEEIRRLFVEDRWSDQRIAEHYRKKDPPVKAYASYINLLRKRHDIKREALKPSERKNAKGDMATRLEAYLKEGKSPKEIAYLLPCSHSYVYRLAARHGLTNMLPRHRKDEDETA